MRRASYATESVRSDAPASPRRRLVIVGNGRRVRDNWLSVARVLEAEDGWQPSYVVARNPARLAATATTWQVDTGSDLRSAVLSPGVSTVAISIPPHATQGVLADLARWAPGVELLLDTPVLPRGLSALGAAGLIDSLASFSEVRVTEDYPRFPQFDLARDAVLADAIGPVRQVTCSRIGYRYHGFSLGRSYFGFDDRARRRVRVRGPYRPLTGRLTIEGDRGAIVVPGLGAMRQPPDAAPGEVAVRRGADGRTVGFVLQVAGRTWTSSPAFGALADHPVSPRPGPIEEDFRACKTLALASVLRSLGRPQDLSSRYDVAQALVDQRSSYRSARIAARLHRELAAGVTAPVPDGVG
jgi:hypothetical protein